MHPIASEPERHHPTRWKFTSSGVSIAAAEYFARSWTGVREAQPCRADFVAGFALEAAGLRARCARAMSRPEPETAR